MNTKLCPYCSSEIEKSALRCRYCRAELFDFKTYMSEREWFGWSYLIFALGVGCFQILKAYVRSENITGPDAGFIIFGGLAVYAIAVILIAYFYHYSQFQKELNKRIQENIKLKRTYKYTASHPIREKSNKVSAKGPKSFTTTSAFKDEKYDEQNKIRTSDDLKDNGFKVITKVKD